MLREISNMSNSTNDLVTKETIGQYSLTTKKKRNELTPLIHIISQVRNAGTRLLFTHFYIPLTNRVRGPYSKLRTEFFPPRFMAQA